MRIYPELKLLFTQYIKKEFYSLLTRRGSGVTFGNFLRELWDRLLDVEI